MPALSLLMQVLKAGRWWYAYLSVDLRIMMR